MLENYRFIALLENHSLKKGNSYLSHRMKMKWVNILQRDNTVVTT